MIEFIPGLAASLRAQDLHLQLRALWAERDALPDPYAWRVSKTGNVVSGRYAVQIHQRAAPLDSKGDARAKARKWLRAQRGAFDERRAEIARQILAISEDPDIRARVPGSYTAAEIAQIINAAQAGIPPEPWVSATAASLVEVFSSEPGVWAVADGNTITFTVD